MPNNIDIFNCMYFLLITLGKKGKEAVRLTTATGYDTIVEGHDDDIVCKISENIPNKVIWKKDSTIINNQFITQNTYSIREATKSDAGTYSCEVIFQPFKDFITIGIYYHLIIF